MMRYREMMCVLAIGLMSASCSEKGGADAGTPDLAVARNGMLCSDARADHWVLPLVKTSQSGRYHVHLTSSQAPIPVIGDNMTSWTIGILDDQGAVSGADVSVDLYMPDHHHGSTVVPGVTDSGMGTYTLSPLYFYMAGYWTVTIHIDAPDSDGGVASDQVVFSLCLTDGG